MIVQGEKSVELRRVKPNISPGDLLFFYETAPTKALRAAAYVKELVGGTPKDIQDHFGSAIGVTQNELYEYFADSKKAYGISFRQVHEFKSPFPLSTLKEIWPGFNAPQGYRYISKKEFSSLAEHQPKTQQQELIDLLTVPNHP